MEEEIELLKKYSDLIKWIKGSLPRAKPPSFLRSFSNQTLYLSPGEYGQANIYLPREEDFLIKGISLFTDLPPELLYQFNLTEVTVYSSPGDLAITHLAPTLLVKILEPPFYPGWEVSITMPRGSHIGFQIQSPLIEKSLVEKLVGYKFVVHGSFVSEAK